MFSTVNMANATPLMNNRYLSQRIPTPQQPAPAWERWTQPRVCRALGRMVGLGSSQPPARSAVPGRVALRRVECDSLAHPGGEDVGAHLARVRDRHVAHPITVTDQQSLRVVEVGPAPEAEVHLAREGLDVGEGPVRLEDGLRPLDRLAGLRCRLAGGGGGGGGGLAPPVTAPQDVGIERLL